MQTKILLSVMHYFSYYYRETNSYSTAIEINCEKKLKKLWTAYLCYNKY
jgi:hypothetical protein